MVGAIKSCSEINCNDIIYLFYLFIFIYLVGNNFIDNINTWVTCNVTRNVTLAEARLHFIARHNFIASQMIDMCKFV